MVMTPQLPLLQKQVILIKESNQEGPHLDMCQKYHPINLDKSIWTCPT
jgi:hypothetical protein